MRPVAFISGASRGIGRETAIAFARAGFDLAIGARTLTPGDAHAHAHAHAVRHADGRVLAGSLADTAEAARVLGAAVLPLRMDLLDEASLRQAARDALDRFGRVDVLINNALYQGEDLNRPFLELETQTLARVAQGYLIAPFLLARALVPTMLEHGGGTVINITSGAGECDPPVPAGQGGWGYAYGAGKAAVSRLSGILARELGEQGIRAYTVNPGVVATETLEATLGEAGVRALGQRAAPPTLPAAVLRWLATSPEAPAHQYRTLHAQ
ncbi:MAG: SDR family oxidoreductase, partial [Halomonas sp.]|nr:SDR family oxidoreductase [Halomonas sp.]